MCVVLISRPSLSRGTITDTAVPHDRRWREHDDLAGAGAEWARADQAVALTEVITQHAGGSGIAFLWEQQLLNTPVPAR